MKKVNRDNMRLLLNNKVFVIIVVVLSLILCFTKHFFIAIGILYIMLFTKEYVILLYQKDQKERDEYIRGLNLKVNPEKKNILSEIYIPIMYLSLDGKVIWCNDRLYFDLEYKELVGKNIKEISTEINIKSIIEGKRNCFRNIKIKNKIYDIHTNYIKDSNLVESKNIMVLTFVDITEKINLISEINNIKESIMLIEVDNLDDVIKTTDEELRPQIVADIERMVNNYANSLEAMIKKYSSSKYIVSVKDTKIEQEMSKKFSILDSIREINCGNKLTVTLSIGVGRGGKTPAQNLEFATSAKDLALGRGGDQCVVKNFEKISFYGGKAKEVEKRTKVRARVIGHALLELINESSNIFIMGHHNPDMDCLGSAVGMYSIIKDIGKECYIVLDEPHNAVNNMILKLNETGNYNHAFIKSQDIKNIKNEKSLLILVDVQNESYVLSNEVVKSVDRLVIIDHHRKTKDFIQGSILSYVETYASSTSELVTELIQYMVDKPNLKEEEAVALLSGICLDTKNFCFKTGVRTFEAAAFLRRLGADTVDVKKIFSEELDVYITRAEIIRTAVVNNGVAIAKCPPNINNLVLTAQAADELLNIIGIKASFVISKLDEGVYISGRSLGDINVQVILEDLGGGGHFTMAGAKMKNTSIDQAEILLNQSIENYLRKGDE